MRKLLAVSVALALVALFLFYTSSVTFAQGSLPTPRAMSAPASPPTPTPRRLYLPLILKGVGGPAAKKGVSIVDSSECSIVATMNAWWQFSWSPNPPICAGAENVPMIPTTADISTTLGGNSQWVMGFNEPDEWWQPAYMSPDDGARAWRLVEQKYPNRKLLSPGTGSEDTYHWLTNFRNSYIAQYNQPPRMDGLAAHCLKWVASQDTEDGGCVPKYITWANDWGASEVWVTEFAFANLDSSSPPCGVSYPPTSDAIAAGEERTFLDWMNSQPKVTRYAWFTSREVPGTQNPYCFYTPLVDYNNLSQPTIFGTTYITYH